MARDRVRFRVTFWRRVSFRVTAVAKPRASVSVSLGLELGLVLG